MADIKVPIAKPIIGEEEIKNLLLGLEQNMQLQLIQEHLLYM